MRTSIYTGLQKGAATRRNRYLRGARRFLDILQRYPFGIPFSVARNIAEWDLQIEGAFLMSDGALQRLVTDLLRARVRFNIERARYWHRDWKKYAALNREWRKEMAALD